MQRTARDRFVWCGPVRLYVREVGLGRPLVVVHGGPDFNHRYLRPELDRLAERCRVVYYDQRGRGRSFAVGAAIEVTMQSEVDDLDGVRRRLGLDTVALLGHSWGALVAMEYALAFPAQVSQLIVMNPAPASPDDAAICGSACGPLAPPSSRSRSRLWCPIPGIRPVTSKLTPPTTGSTSPPRFSIRGCSRCWSHDCGETSPRRESSRRERLNSASTSKPGTRRRRRLAHAWLECWMTVGTSPTSTNPSEPTMRSPDSSPRQQLPASRSTSANRLHVRHRQPHDRDCTRDRRLPERNYMPGIWAARDAALGVVLRVVPCGRRLPRPQLASGWRGWHTYHRFRTPTDSPAGGLPMTRRVTVLRQARRRGLSVVVELGGADLKSELLHEVVGLM